ncbi:MAG: hypothetical protein IPP82_05295 [Xanthomonadales bacterium]|nr:hypothetical protein [Xanthomonadales bacterium]
MSCVSCVPDYSADALNENCFCVASDPSELRAELESLLAARGVSASMAQTHPHLFASLPVYVPPLAIKQIASVVEAVDAIAMLPAFREAVMAWAPAIARKDPGSPGGLLGLDFHLTANGPRLIEINTNPGGVLLNAMLAQAQRICMPKQMVATSDPSGVDDAIIEIIKTEWHLQRGTRELASIAIVDESPTGQYLYPEFLLFQDLFRRHGYEAEICTPQALDHQDHRLELNGRPLDLIYNRLTDFALQKPENHALREAYVAGDVALSPHPHAHALYADKRNLILLGNANFLAQAGASPGTLDTLSNAIPMTRLVSADNRDWLWVNRRDFFFKPAGGYGSRAAYRGDKLTRRVWDEIAAAAYVAQAIVKPSERRTSESGSPLKVDIRCYAYRGKALLYAARLYQGQTTNFRTPGGGFAPVLTMAQANAENAGNVL